MNRRPLTREAFLDFQLRSRNWGRWGDDDQRGALNLITEGKRVEAAAMVTSGHTVSLARTISSEDPPGNTNPPLHYMRRYKFDDYGTAHDFLGISCHGTTTTHIDGLSHLWGPDGMWNARDPDREITFDGANWGSIEAWSTGILTRALLFDIPRYRGEPYVTMDKPVYPWELEDIKRAEGWEVSPGDALVIYSGRESWDRDNPAWGSESSRPGLHASCLTFIRESDCAVVVWDMMDMRPNAYGLRFPVHSALFLYGTALVDCALLEPLAATCQEQGRTEFMLVVSPLRIRRGTASPVNPLAIF